MLTYLPHPISSTPTLPQDTFIPLVNKSLSGVYNCGFFGGCWVARLHKTPGSYRALAVTWITCLCLGVPQPSWLILLASSSQDLQINNPSLESFVKTTQNGLTVPQKVKHTVIIRPSNPTFRCTPKRTENTCPHKHFYTKCSQQHYL